MEIKTLPVNGVNYYAVKFGGEIRTVLSNPLTYKDPNNLNVTLSDGNYTICHAVEFVGDKFGDATYTDARFQVLVGDLCTSSYTDGKFLFGCLALDSRSVFSLRPIFHLFVFTVSGRC
jgi:hypothetical protein